MMILANSSPNFLILAAGLVVAALIVWAVVTSGNAREREESLRRKKASRVQAKRWLRQSAEAGNLRASRASDTADS